MSRKYGYGSVHGAEGSWWYIGDVEAGEWPYKEVWRMPYTEGHDLAGRPPAELRAKFEELSGRGEYIESAPLAAVNIVELIADADDCAFDQPCAHGYRVETHAVYCHNEGWLYAPRKCHRHQGTEWEEPYPHEACGGFKPNMQA